MRLHVRSLRSRRIAAGSIGAPGTDAYSRSTSIVAVSRQTSYFLLQPEKYTECELIDNRRVGFFRVGLYCVLAVFNLLPVSRQRFHVRDPFGKRVNVLAHR
ncbi:hypothetical protein [Burkholderia sp. BCC0419]|uniref:hypothetical protein n=1 Tax=Burkholderia sp. BCC0419 TaxID=486878 RepID=UPI00158EB320|nr:hypothetical protein [Burkholderia sp. BCC0419]